MKTLRVPPTAAKLPDEFQDLEVIDKQGTTRPLPTLANARVALHLLGCRFSHNLFTGKKFVAGIEVSSDVNGQLTDEVVTMLRLMIREHHGFDPGINSTWQAVNVFCREHPFHPVKDYLESLSWDGVPRIERMLIDYFGAPDTPFIRCVSELVMIASVRRIYQPGAKFDYMTVLESTEGYAKSSALAALYGAEFFSDQTIIGLSDKDLAEAVKGRWCIESADLSGMHKGQVEQIKAQLSRFEDRARPAYGRAVIDAPRSSIMWGTTNEREYLRSQTGNRRFLPVPVLQAIDVQAIKRDRDQLWAEAFAQEPLFESILLPEKMWADAGAEQDRRTLRDAWEETLANVSSEAAAYERMRAKAATMDRDVIEPPAYQEQEDVAGVMHERVTTGYILTKLLGIPVDRQTAEHAKRVGIIMRRLKWEGPDLYKIGRRAQRGYQRETF